MYLMMLRLKAYENKENIFRILTNSEVAWGYIDALNIHSVSVTVSAIYEHEH